MTSSSKVNLLAVFLASFLQLTTLAFNDGVHNETSMMEITPFGENVNKRFANRWLGTSAFGKKPAAFESMDKRFAYKWLGKSAFGKRAESALGDVPDKRFAEKWLGTSAFGKKAAESPSAEVSAAKRYSAAAIIRQPSAMGRFASLAGKLEG